MAKRALLMAVCVSLAACAERPATRSAAPLPPGATTAASGDASTTRPAIAAAATAPATQAATMAAKAGYRHYPIMPGFAVDRSKQTPDYCQTDPAGGLPGNGRSYCGPSSTSDGMMFLSRNGFAKLRPVDDKGGAIADDKAAQIAMIKGIAAPGRMATVDGEGTSPLLLCQGIRKYVESCGYALARLDQENWRSSPKAYPSREAVPSLGFIQSGLKEPNSIVVINIGWYTYDADKQEYTRTGGHWIDVVGCGTGADGKPDENVLIVHDPSPSAGMEFFTQHAVMTPIHGTLKYGKMTRSADGMFKLTGEFSKNPKCDAGILDGAVVAVLKPQNATTAPKP